MARRASVHRTPSQWQALIDQQALSKQRVTRFCQENGLTVSSFYLWRQKLVRQQTRMGGTSHMNPPLFVELEPKRNISPAQEDHSSDWAVELEIGNNIILRVRQ